MFHHGYLYPVFKASLRLKRKRKKEKQKKRIYKKKIGSGRYLRHILT